MYLVALLNFFLILSWSIINGLQLNPKKSQLICISSHVNSDLLEPLTLNNIFIPYLKTVSWLGFTISDNLSWNRLMFNSWIRNKESKSNHRIHANIYTEKTGLVIRKKMYDRLDVLPYKFYLRHTYYSNIFWSLDKNILNSMVVVLWIESYLLFFLNTSSFSYIFFLTNIVNFRTLLFIKIQSIPLRRRITTISYFSFFTTNIQFLT